MKQQQCCESSGTDIVDKAAEISEYQQLTEDMPHFLPALPSHAETSALEGYGCHQVDGLMVYLLTGGHLRVGH
jgi:hypothetical protein